MTELRQDPTTRNWVIVAPERGLRPHDARAGDGVARDGDRDATANTATTAPALGALPPVVGATPAAQATTPAAGGATPAAQATCPFCPGNEAMTPPEIWRSGTPQVWRIRVVPNKYPALAPDGGLQRVHRAGLVSMAGHGHHELIVESPRHDWDLATGSAAEVAEILLAYRLRYEALRARGDSALVVLFRNHGSGSGTSLDHPHSQVLATPVVPLLVRRRFDVARQHFDDMGTCLYEELAQREVNEGARIVDLDADFVAFVPFAASAPYETWIMPRTRQASFGATSDDQLGALARLLRRVLSALRRVAEDPPYNLVIHSAPAGDERSRYFLWHMQVMPRLSTAAGFELATGIPINPSAPEETAARLRAGVAAEGRD